MYYISKRLTDYILKKGVIEEKDYDIYNYGFVCFFEVMLSTVTSIIIALFLGMLRPCLFFFLIFIPMRSYGGGLHLNSYFACYIASCLILTISLLAIKYVTLPLFVSFLIYIASAAFIFLIGPVDHPNRSVNAYENDIFKKKTNITLFFSTVISVILLFYRNNSYLMLEAIIFVFLAVTLIAGKKANR